MKTKKLSVRLYEALFPQSPRQHKRFYAAASQNRQNTQWATFPTSPNWEIRQSGRILRARARQMAHDNSFFKKYLSMVRANIIGPKGFQLQSRARGVDGTLDAVLNKQVEEAFWKWCHRETCTVSGKLDWLAVQRLIVTHLARDGEFLVQKVTVKTRENPFGFALKVINVDYLDSGYNRVNSDTGNRIIMSVEVDKNDKPVAYWLTTPILDATLEQMSGYLVPVRVPAEEIIHGFLTFDDESQVRGITWFHAAMLDAKNYQGYTTGVINSARMASNSFGILKNTVPEIDSLPYEGEDDEQGQAMTPTIDVSPLSFTELPPGYEMQQFDPKQPTQNHAAFAKSVLMDIATGLDVPYFNLSGDMEAVNFSSSRVGLDDTREIWKGLQDFVSTMFCREVFHSWVRSAVLSRQLTLDAKQMAEVQNPMWRGRGWKYIDPTKDASADVMLLENKLASWTGILANRGEDIVDFFETLKAEKELAAKYGIDLQAVSAIRVTDAGTAPAADSGTPAPPPKTPKREYSNGQSLEDDLVN